MKLHALRTAAFAMVAAFAQLLSFGETATVNGYTWVYQDEGYLRITGVQPTPSGKVVVPAELNGNEVGALDAIFSNCPDLTEVVLPKCIQGIAENAFDGSPKLKSISMGMSASAAYFTLDGVLYEGNRMGDATLVRVPEGYEAECFKGLVGPRVTGIYENAFANCGKIEKIAVNDFCAESVEATTFAGCTSFREFVWMGPDYRTRSSSGDDCGGEDYEGYLVYDGALCYGSVWYWYESGRVSSGDLTLAKIPTAVEAWTIEHPVYGFGERALAGTQVKTLVLTDAWNIPRNLENILSDETLRGSLEKVVCRVNSPCDREWPDFVATFKANDPEAPIAFETERVVDEWMPDWQWSWTEYGYGAYGLYSWYYGAKNNPSGSVVLPAFYSVETWYWDETSGGYVTKKVQKGECAFVECNAFYGFEDVTSITFPYTIRQIYWYEPEGVSLANVEEFVFEGRVPEGIDELIASAPKLKRIVHSRCPRFADEWNDLRETHPELTFAQADEPTEPQFYFEDDGETLTCVWPAKGEVTVPCVWNGRAVRKIQYDAFLYFDDGERRITADELTKLRLPASLRDVDENAFEGLTSLAAFEVYRPSREEFRVFQEERWDDDYWGYRLFPDYNETFMLGEYSRPGESRIETVNGVIYRAWTEEDLVYDEKTGQEHLVQVVRRELVKCPPMLEDIALADGLEYIYECAFTGGDRVLRFGDGQTWIPDGLEDALRWAYGEEAEDEKAAVVRYPYSQDFWDNDYGEYVADTPWLSLADEVRRYWTDVRVTFEPVFAEDADPDYSWMFADDGRALVGWIRGSENNPRGALALPVGYNNRPLRDVSLDMLGTLGGVTSIVFPHTVRTLSWRDGDDFTLSSVTNLVFEGVRPEGLEDLLCRCPNLQTVVYSANPRYQEGWACLWVDYPGLDFVKGEVPSEPQWYCVDDGRLGDGCSLDDEYGFPCVWPTPQGELKVPFAVNGYPVFEISENAFKGFSNVTKIVLPSCVREISPTAFRACTALEEISFYTPSREEYEAAAMRWQEWEWDEETETDVAVWYYDYPYDEIFGENREMSSLAAIDGCLYRGEFFEDDAGEVSLGDLTLLACPAAKAEVNVDARTAYVDCEAFVGGVAKAVTFVGDWLAEGLQDALLAEGGTVARVRYPYSPYSQQCEENRWTSFIVSYTEGYPDVPVVFEPIVGKDAPAKGEWVVRVSDYDGAAVRDFALGQTGNPVGAMTIPAFGEGQVPVGSVEVPGIGFDAVTSLRFPSTLSYVWWQLPLPNVTELVFDGDVPEGFYELLDRCPNLRTVVYSANPRFAENWSYVAVDCRERGLVMALGEVPSDPTWNAEDCFGEGATIVGEEERPGFWGGEALPADFAFPSSVDGLPLVGIADNALCGTTNLTSIAFPYTVRSIGALGGDLSNVTNLTFWGGVPEGFDELVAQCANLQSVVFSANPRYREGWAEAQERFSGFAFVQGPEPEEPQWFVEGGVIGGEGMYFEEGLSNDWFAAGFPCAWPAPKGAVTVPERWAGYRISGIASGAFYGMDEITSLKLPNVEWIGDFAFKGCTSLERFEMDEPESSACVKGGVGPVYSVTDGILVNEQEGWCVCYPAAKPETHVELPSVYYYGTIANAFLETVVVDEWMVAEEAISMATFAGCPNFKKMEVVVPAQSEYDFTYVNGLILADRGETLRGFTDRLETAVVPPSVRGVDCNAFYGVVGLKKIVCCGAPWCAETAQAIREVLAEYPELVDVEVVLGDPTGIEWNASFEDGDGAYLDGTEAFPCFWCAKVPDELELPEKVNGYPVVWIGPYALFGPTNVTAISFPYTVRGVSYLEGDLASVRRLVFWGDVPEGLGDLLSSLPNVTEIVYSANPRYWQNWMDWITREHENGSPIAYTKGRVPATPQWYVRDGVLGYDSWEWTYDEAMGRDVLLGFPCVWPAPEGEVEAPATWAGQPIAEIAEYAFAGLDGITALRLPRVNWIAENAFAGCTSLERFEMAAPKIVDYGDGEIGWEDPSPYYVEDGVLLSIGLDIGWYPAAKEGANYELPYGNIVFDGCRNLETVTVSYDMFAESWLTVERFATCPNFREVVIRDSKGKGEWRDYVFYGGMVFGSDGQMLLGLLRNDESVKIPDGFKNPQTGYLEVCGIDTERAFAGCTRLKRVSVGVRAFLESGLSLAVFADCPDFEEIVVRPDKSGEYGDCVCRDGLLLRDDGRTLCRVVGQGDALDIPDGVFETDCDAFVGVRGLKEIAFPYTMRSYASFDVCDVTGVEKLTFRGDVPDAFWEMVDQMPNLKEIVYLGNPRFAENWTQVIGEFAGSYPDRDIRFVKGEDPVEPQWYIVDGCIGGRDNWVDWDEATEQEVLCGYPCVWPAPKGELVCPDIWDGYDVCEIGVGAFAGLDQVMSIVLPRFFSSIDDNPAWAFRGCSSLEAFKGKFGETDGMCEPAWSGDYSVENGVLRSRNGDFGWYPAAKRELVYDYDGCGVIFDGCRYLEEVVVPESAVADGYVRLADFATCPNFRRIRLRSSCCEYYVSVVNGLFVRDGELLGLAERQGTVVLPKDAWHVRSEAFDGVGEIGKIVGTGYAPSGLADAIACGDLAPVLAIPENPRFRASWGDLVAELRESYEIRVVTEVAPSSGELEWCYDFDEVDGVYGVVLCGVDEFPCVWPMPADGRLTVPEEIDGYPVIGVASGAFQSEGTNLVSVSFPATLRYAYDSFLNEECHALEDVTLPVSADGFCPGECERVRLTLIPATHPDAATDADRQVECRTVRGEFACGSLGLVEVTVAEGIWVMSGAAFCDCPNLAKVTLPSSLLCVDSDALAYCPALTETYFNGDAPVTDETAFEESTNFNVRVCLGTTGWSGIEGDAEIPATWYAGYAEHPIVGFDVDIALMVGADVWTNLTVVAGTQVGELPRPTEDGLYVHLGWYDGADLVRRVDDARRIPAAGTAFYAFRRLELARHMDTDQFAFTTGEGGEAWYGSELTAPGGGAAAEAETMKGIDDTSRLTDEEFEAYWNDNLLPHAPWMETKVTGPCYFAYRVYRSPLSAETIFGADPEDLVVLTLDGVKACARSTAKSASGWATLYYLVGEGEHTVRWTTTVATDLTGTLTPDGWLENSHAVPVTATVGDIQAEAFGPRKDLADWTEKLVRYRSWNEGELAGFAQAEEARFADTPDGYAARLRHAYALLAGLGESAALKSFCASAGLELDFLTLSVVNPGTFGPETAPVNDVVDAVVASDLPVIEAALADLEAIPEDWDGGIVISPAEYPVDVEIAIDAADRQYLKWMLETAIAAIRYLAGYDLTVDWPTLKALGDSLTEGELKDAQHRSEAAVVQFLDEQKRFFSKARNLESLALSRESLRAAFRSALAADRLVQARVEDGKLHLFEYDVRDERAIRAIFDNLHLALESLDAPVDVDLEKIGRSYDEALWLEKTAGFDVSALPNGWVARVYLGALFEGNLNRKSFPDVYLSEAGRLTVMDWAAPDPTLAGLFPDLDQIGFSSVLRQAAPSNCDDNVYTVVFDGGAEDVRGTMAAMTASCVRPTPLPPCAFEREGYVFVGWRLPNGQTCPAGGSVQALAEKDGQATVTAAWEEDVSDQIRLTLHANFGLDATEEVWLKAGDALETAAEYGFVSPGNDFIGWFTAAQGGVKVTEVTEDLVAVYAHWKSATRPAEKVSVILCANDGTGLCATNECKAGTTFGTPACPFEREGYDFTGWYYDADAKAVIAAETTVKAELTAFAGWRAAGSSEPTTPAYGPWGDGTIEGVAPVAPTVMTGVRVMLSGQPVGYGDVIRVYEFGTGKTCGFGQVDGADGTATIVFYAKEGTLLGFQLWQYGTDLETVYESAPESVLIAPAPGSDVVGSQTIVFLGEDGVSLTLATGAAGWNMVSLNVEPYDATPEGVFGALGSAVEMVMPAGSAQLWRPGRAGTLKEIESGRAYWVRTTEDNQVWTVSGTPADAKTAMTLYAGWNLVGYVPQTAMPVGTALKTALEGGLITTVVDGSAIYRADGVGTLAQLMPGRAYWVYAPQGGELAYDAAKKMLMAGRADDAPAYGPWGDGSAVANAERLAPTILSVGFAADGTAAQEGDCVALYRTVDGVAVLCGLGRVGEDGQADVVCYAPQGERLSARLWLQATGVDLPGYVEAEELIRAPAPGSGVEEPEWVEVTLSSAGFAETEVSVAEGEDLVIRVKGGDSQKSTAVSVGIAYLTAAASDLDLAKMTADGVLTKKFPVTLRWEAGEVGEKEIVIPVKTDKTKEGDERFLVQLYDPVKLTLGEKTVCTVTVEDRTAGGVTRTDPYVAAVSALAEGGTVSGSGYLVDKKKVTLKAKAAKNFRFVGWYSALGCDSNAFVCATATLVVDRTGKEKDKVGVQTVIDGQEVADDVAYYALFERQADNVRRVSIAYDAACGKVTGAGYYVVKDAKTKVTVKATASKGYVFVGWYDNALGEEEFGGELLGQSASLVLQDLTGDVDLAAKFVSVADDMNAVSLALYGVGAEGGPATTDAKNKTTRTMSLPPRTELCGVPVEWPLDVAALTPVTVKAAKLPSGLKLVQDKTTKAYSVTGVPTAASKAKKGSDELEPSKVVFTVTTAGKSAVTVTLDLTVKPLPAELIGTYDGAVADEEGLLGCGGDGLVTLTVKANGGVSGKFTMNSENGAKALSFSAKSFSAYYADDGILVLEPEIKLASKQVVKPTLYFSAEPEALGGRDQWTVWTFADDAFCVAAARNVWSDKANLFPAGVALPVFPKNATVTFRGTQLGEGYDEDEFVTFKFGAKGKVTVSSKFYVTDIKKNTRKLTALTGSAQLVLTEFAEGMWSGAARVAIPAKKGTDFGGFYRTLEFRAPSGSSVSLDEIELDLK